MAYLYRMTYFLRPSRLRMVGLLSGKCVLPRGTHFIFTQILAVCLSKSQCHPFCILKMNLIINNSVLATVFVGFNFALELMLEGNCLYSLNNNETHFHFSDCKARKSQKTCDKSLLNTQVAFSIS